MPPALQELDSLPPGGVSVEEVVQRCTREPTIFRTEDVASAILTKSGFFGVVSGASRVELTDRHGTRASFYADRDAKRPVADILESILGERFKDHCK
jgi:hypothetical protein